MAPRTRHEVGPVHRLAEVPYSPGWLDRLVHLIGRLPGSNTGYCALIAIAQGAWLLGGLWWTGNVPVGSVPWPKLFSIVITPALLWGRFNLDRIAASCMDRFRPMLAVEDEEFERLRYELTTLSARTTNLVTLCAVGALVVNALVAPERWLRLWGGSARLFWMAVAPVAIPTVAVVAVSLAQAVHQLGMVDRIHALAGPIDIRRAKPLHAFSRLTALTGMGFILLATYVIGMRRDLIQALPAVGALTVALIPIGIACFLLPLRGIHERLVDARDRAIAQVEDRLATVYARVHEQVDAGRPDDPQALKHQIDSLSVEMANLKQLSTWPWETSTLTGFLTALVMPILLWILQRMLERSGL